MKFFDLSACYNDLNLQKLKIFFPNVETSIKTLSSIQNHEYTNKKIAALALIHRSALVYWPKDKENIFSNEKLEYLGDSFLNFFIAAYSMSLVPTLSEGELSKLRAVIVGSESLAKKSRSLNIGSCLLFGKTEKDVSYGNQNNILADAFEAVTAALLLDAGYTKTAQWLCDVFEDDILSVSKNLSHMDAKGALQHWAQSMFGAIPIYHSRDVTDDKRHPLFEVSLVINERKVVSARGKTKKEASKKVAQEALKLIEQGLFK